MKSFLIAILAQTVPASVPPGGLPTPADASPGASAARGVDFVRGGINVFDHLDPAERRDVRTCGLGRDVTAGIRAAVAAAVRRGAGRIVLPSGCYRTTATIVLPSNVELVGASLRGTRLMPAGDFPAIMAAGTYAAGLTGVGTENMSIVCAGMHHPNAMGIKLVYVNRGKLKDLYFNGCRHALDLYDQWQTTIDNVSADGLGAQQNAVGVYMGAPTDPANKAPNNAVVLSNATMQNVALYGYELIFFAGSKFFNDEAMNGKIGWKLCGEAYLIADQACQFGHFYNILADTIDGPGVSVDQGQNAQPVNNIMLDNVWIGSSTGHALHVAGTIYSQFDGVHITRADTGIYLHNSSHVRISANVAQYNRNDDGGLAAIISGGSNNTLVATNNQSDHPAGYNGIAEIGPAHGNLIWGGTADCSLGLAFGNGSGVPGRVYPARSCRYEVQGRRVQVTFQFGLAGLGSSAGAAQLIDLPFMADAGQLQEGPAGSVLADAMVGLDDPILAQIIPGSFAMRLLRQGKTGPIPVTSANFTPASSLAGSVEYTRR